MIQITFPDKSVLSFKEGVTGLEIAKKIGEGLARAALAIQVDHNMIDLSVPINKSASIKIITYKDKEGKEIFKHSSSHILAAAVKRLFKDVKFGIGPAIEEGYYYDFDADKTFSPEDLEKIEKEMQKIIKEDIKFERKELTQAEAKKLFKDQPYKLELIEEMEHPSIYKLGDFTDLCKGPHVQSSGVVKSVKLMKAAGAYWKGDSSREQLQRIYGICFAEEKELKAYLKLLQEAEARDHRKLGREMNLIMSHEYAPGMPFFLPNGFIMLLELWKFVREYSYGPGYKEVRTPHLFNVELWKQSGHWDHYKDCMFHMHHAEDNIDLGIKPMNCPAHMLIFKRDVYSYKELPLRIAETTTLYRDEKSGTLTGLTRVRSLSQDDTHIFLGENQIFEEIKILLEKVKQIYKIFALPIDEISLSTRPESFLGEKSTWDFAEANLKKALEISGLKYKVDEGGGAFYGPKIDIKVKDAIGRQWQLATIQLDYQLPRKFELQYDDIDGKRKTPVVIHRALLGSVERFLGVIIEHFAGWFPLWLSPVQVEVITVAERFSDYAEEVVKELKKNGIRAFLNNKNETIGKKVRDSQIEKVPIVLNIGEKEVDAKTVAVRTNKDGKVKFNVTVDDLISKVKSNIDKKEIEFKI